MNKEIWFEDNANKEIDSFPVEVRNRIRGLVSVLMELGQLREPDAKKLKPQSKDKKIEKILK